MNPRVTRLAVAAVRLWTRAYTCGLPAATRARRRADVASDLWESVHDRGPDGRRSLPLSIAGRLLRGIPDDLGWRLEQQEETMTRSLRLGMALTAGLAGVFALWLVTALSRSDLPEAPAAARWPPAAARIPPPPPPPPPAPPGGRQPEDIPLVYAETSYTATGAATPPGKVRDVPPAYPPMALWGGLHGRVSIEATVDAGGRVADARVLAPAIRMLDQSALDAVKQWEFEPTIVNGAPVAVVIVATVTFSPPR